jgi:hypothetical protein
VQQQVQALAAHSRGESGEPGRAEAAAAAGLGLGLHADRRVHTLGVVVFLLLALALYFAHSRQGAGPGGGGGLMAAHSSGSRSPSGGLLGGLVSIASGGRAAAGSAPVGGGGAGAGLEHGAPGVQAAGSPYRSLSGSWRRHSGGLS